MTLNTKTLLYWKVPTISSLALSYHVCVCTCVKAFVVVGPSSMLTLLPGARTWTPLAPLPMEISALRASIVRGKLRVTGGSIGGYHSSQVKF